MTKALPFFVVGKLRIRKFSSNGISRLKRQPNWLIPVVKASQGLLKRSDPISGQIAPHQVSNLDIGQYQLTILPKMTKPIGYYTSYTPGDDGLLAEMQEAWGTRFEALGNVERAWMIAKIAENLCADFSNETEDDSKLPGEQDETHRN